MKLVVPRENFSDEDRVSITPECLASLVKMGFKVFVEADAGMSSSYTNDDYKKNEQNSSKSK